MFNVHAYEPSQQFVCYVRGNFLLLLPFFLNNEQIDKSGPVTQNMRGSKTCKIIIFCLFSFFSKMHFLQQMFCFQFSSGGGGVNKEGRSSLHVKQSVKMKSIKKQMHQFRKGGKCVTKYFPIFAFVLHHVSVNHAFHTPTSTRQKSSSDVCKDHFFFKKKAKNSRSHSSGPIYITF